MKPKFDDSFMRETISKQQVVLYHLGYLSKLTTQPNVDVGQYSAAIEFLSAMMDSLKDDKFREVEAELIKKRQESFELARQGVGEKRTYDSRKRAALYMANKKLFGEYCYGLLTALSCLADRKGLGWTREGIADFAGYRTVLEKCKEAGYSHVGEIVFANKIAQMIQMRMHKDNRNWLCIVIGKVGTGKSYSASALAKIFDPSFGIDRVCFTEDEFMTLVRSGLPKGSFVLADETGTWFGNRDYMRECNRLLSYVLQTFRNKNMGIIWTVPQKRQLDLNVRSMADVEIETVKIWDGLDICFVKMKNVEVNPATGQDRTPFNKLEDADNSMTTITRTLVPKPDETFLRAYEKKKGAWQTKQYEQWHGMLKEGNPMTKKKKVTKKDLMINDITKGTLTSSEIAKKYGVTSSYVGKLKRDNDFTAL